MTMLNDKNVFTFISLMCATNVLFVWAKNN